MPEIAWEMLWSIGALVLAIVIAYGAFRYLARRSAEGVTVEERAREDYDRINLRKNSARSSGTHR